MINGRKTDAKPKDKYDRFKRSEKTRDVRPVFLIAPEGKNTEPDYFRIILPNCYPNIRPNIRILMAGEKRERGVIQGNDPRKLKKRLQGELRKFKGVRCEGWIVLDRDRGSWTVEQLNEIAQWVNAENKKNEKKEEPVIHGIALSNPCFEFWLLLHFEENIGTLDNNQCQSMWKKKVEHYDEKSLDDPNIKKLFNKDAIEKAIKQSKMRNIGYEDEAWPQSPGRTTVHLLVQRILNAAER
jgi:hypothetical protein